MRRRTGFLLGILFELLAVFGLFAPYALLASKGTEITLRTVPVDPRSVFRGDYVVLDYEVGNDVPFADASLNADTLLPLVYVVLENKGEVYERVATSKTMPTLKEGQVCLRGTPSTWFDNNGANEVQVRIPDLAQYFVEEGLGRELESANNAHRLLVKAAVTPSCMAVLKGVVLGPEVPQSEFPVAPGIETKPEPVTPAV